MAGMRRYNQIYHTVKKLSRRKQSKNTETTLVEKSKSKEGDGRSNSEDLPSDGEPKSRKAERGFKVVSGFDDA